MKLLILCEGPNELAVVQMLLEADCFVFSRDDLLGLRPYHARQIDKSSAVKLELNIYSGSVKVLRIGDVMSDKLKIPAQYTGKIVAVEKYCTKPELEMLLILAEHLEREFEKVRAGKNRVSPKDFCKAHVQYNRKRYNNSTQFYYDYFGSDISKLVSAIRAYRGLQGAHKKDEGYLADLLK